ncbi:MAG: hypothetical protein R3F27_10895 [Gammaproteobacteria bacterium]
MAGTCDRLTSLSITPPALRAASASICGPLAASQMRGGAAPLWTGR